LQRNENPVFALSWTIFRVVDEQSPLYGLSADDLAGTDVTLVLTVSGLDDSSAQQLNARRSYSQEQIRWNHRYVDVLTSSSNGRLLVDYAKFHNVTPAEKYGMRALPSHCYPKGGPGVGSFAHSDFRFSPDKMKRDARICQRRHRLRCAGRVGRNGEIFRSGHDAVR
jgi:hypothetical protein